MTGCSHGSLGLVWMGRCGICNHGSLGWGWMGRGGRCSHYIGAAVAVWVGGGWAEVGDATMAGMQPWHPGMLGVDGQRWEMKP